MPLNGPVPDDTKAKWLYSKNTIIYIIPVKKSVAEKNSDTTSKQFMTYSFSINFGFLFKALDKS